ncbi:hypothetical protein D3C81_503960 [compost metagenome]|jgi:hypothetical protein
MSIITKLDIGLINLINKTSSTMDISIYNESFWHSISKGGLYSNKQGKLVCFQEVQSPMINRDIVNSRIEINIIEDKKVSLRVIGIIERFIIDEDEFRGYEETINKLFEDVFLDNISIIRPYEIISDDFVFRLGSGDINTLSIQIDKVV